MGVLEDRIAINTGAGRGIGREHALLLSKEGAVLVVNDPGGNNAGEGADAGPAQQVVDEIIAAGGRAVANTDDVADWNKRGRHCPASNRRVRPPRRADEQRRHPVRRVHRRERLTLATPGMGALMVEPEKGEPDLFAPRTSRRSSCTWRPRTARSPVGYARFGARRYRSWPAGKALRPSKPTGRG